MPSQRSNLGTAAGRYAAALFALAEDEDCLDLVHDDLERMDKLLSDNPALRGALENPAIPPSERASVLEEIMKRGGFHALVSKTLGLLLQNRRFPLLPALLENFRVALAARKGEHYVRVVSAAPLSEEAQARTRDILARALASPPEAIRMDAITDPSLLGGMRIEMGGRQIDATLAGKMDRLRDALRAEAS